MRLVLKTPAVVAACLAVLLLASACTDDSPQPNYSSVSTSPTSSTSPTQSDTPPPTAVPATGPNVNPGELPPSAPAAALSNTGEGAQAFAAYYFQTLDWSYAVNSAALMDPLFASDCDNCFKLTDNLSGTFERGTVTGARVTIKQVALVTNDGRGGATYAVDGVLSISAGELAENGATTPLPAEPDVTITLWVQFAGTEWNVVSQAKV